MSSDIGEASGANQSPGADVPGWRDHLATSKVSGASVRLHWMTGMVRLFQGSGEGRQLGNAVVVGVHKWRNSEYRGTLGD